MFRSCLGALLLVAPLAAWTPASAQPIGNYTPPKKAIRLEVSAGKRLYRPGEAVSVTLRFINQGSDPITFAEPADWLKGLEIWRTKDGRPEPMKKAEPGAERGPNQTLEPGKAYEKTLDLGPAIQEEAAYQIGWRYEFALDDKDASIGLWGEPDPQYHLRQFIRPGVARMTTCALWSGATLEQVKATWVELEVAIGKGGGGKIQLEFYPEDAPVTVASFQNLVRTGWFDGKLFHRVIKEFMMQGGDPNRDGTGDAGYKLAQEFSARKHEPGTVSMARGPSPDSAGCQFFICFAGKAHLDNAYTIFGHVVNGMETVKAVEKVRTFTGDRPVDDVVITKASLIEGAKK